MAETEEEKRAERLRRARDLAASRGFGPGAAQDGPTSSASRLPVPASVPKADDSSSDRPGLLDVIKGWFKPRPAQPAAQPKAAAAAVEPPSFTVVVCALAGDGDGAAATFLNQTLSARQALKVKALGKVFQLERSDDPAAVAALALNTRHAVAEENADLLLWGDFSKDGYCLRLATATQDDDRPAAFGPLTRVELPKNFTEPVANLLFAAVLAAADTATEAQRVAQRRLLPAAAAAAESLAQKPPVSMSMGQQRSAQLVFGHVATATALTASPDESDPWFDKAANAYRQAQRRLARTDPEFEAGLLHKHLAAVLAAKAERSKEPASLLEEAIKEWRQAVETLPKATMPQDWAAIQVRLGVGLYRLDLQTGQTDLLREALTALQAALQVYSRTETPNRWAEIMHTIAQVLQVYGDQIKNTDVLKRAVDACHSVLELRTRERTPLSWAAAQNTLGSALFMLDRHNGGSSHLAEAEEALAGALEVFQSHGAKGPAKVAAKNLAHVRQMLETRKAKPGFDPHWLDDQPPPPRGRGRK